MGSAVSSIAGSLGGVLGGGIQGITKGVIPGADLANQEAVNQQIGTLQGQTAGAQQNQSELQRSAGLQANYAQVQAQHAADINNGGNVQNALALLQAQANGSAPSAAEGVLQQGKDQAITSQMAMANSGNLSQMIGGQKTAMDNAANLTQQAANQASQLRANQQAIGQQAYAGAAGQQASQAGINATNANQLTNIQQNAALGYGGLASNTANNAGNLGLGGQSVQQGAMNQAQQQQAGAAGGMLNGMGGAAAAMMMSDEDTKKDIQSDRSSRSKGLSDYFKSENKKEEPKKEDSESKSKMKDYGDETPSQKAARQIKEGFLSDENAKKDVKKDTMLHAFLNKLEPVTYDYKEPTGEMGKTPGKHMGIIAQDVEKAPGGESMVIDTPEGKAIDMASAMGMLMSAAADAHERMSSLEELFKSKKVK